KIVDVEQVAKGRHSANLQTKSLLDHGRIFKLALLSNGIGNGFHVELEMSWNIELIVLLSILSAENERFDTLFHLDVADARRIFKGGGRFVGFVVEGELILMEEMD